MLLGGWGGVVGEVEDKAISAPNKVDVQVRSCNKLASLFLGYLTSDISGGKSEHFRIVAINLYTFGIKRMH